MVWQILSWTGGEVNQHQDTRRALDKSGHKTWLEGVLAYANYPGTKIDIHQPRAAQRAGRKRQG